jgi:hypothetical protein
MATVGENRALRDQYNILLRELRALQEQYNRDRPGIGQDLARDIATFRDIDNKTNSVLFRMEQLQKQNSQNPDLFDPQLAQGIEQNVQAGRNIITASQQVVRQAEQQQQTDAKAKADQGPGTVSTGETVTGDQAANGEGANTQNPAPPSETISADGSTTVPGGPTLPSNAQPGQTPDPNAVAAPEKLPPGTVDPQTGNGTVPVNVGDQGPRAAAQVPGTALDTPDENTNLVSYVYRAYEVTSIFRQGKFVQDVQGAQIFFRIPPRSVQPADSVRTVQDQQATNVARSARQGTVSKTAQTAGVPIAETAAPGLLELEGFSDPTASDTSVVSPQSTAPSPGSLFEAEGFGDPTSSDTASTGATGDQVPAVSPLSATPPTTGSSTTATPVAVGAQQSARGSIPQGQAYETSLQDQLKLARLNEAQFAKALEQVEARIARGEGNPLANREMRALYSTNLRKEREIIADLEVKLARPSQPGAPNTNVSPQVGAKEY